MLVFFYFVKILSTYEDYRILANNDASQIVSIIEELTESSPYNIAKPESCSSMISNSYKISHKSTTYNKNMKEVVNDIEIIESFDSTSNKAIKCSKILYNPSSESKRRKLEKSKNPFEIGFSGQKDVYAHDYSNFTSNVASSSELLESYTFSHSIETDHKLSDSSIVQSNSTAYEDDLLSEIEYNDLYFSNKPSEYFDSNPYLTDVLELEKGELYIPKESNHLIFRIHDSKVNNFIAPCHSNNSIIYFKEENPSVTNTVDKYLNKLIVFLKLDEIEDYTLRGKMSKSHYLNKLLKPLQECIGGKQFFKWLVDEAFSRFYKLISTFDIEKSRQYQSSDDTFILFHLDKILYVCSEEIFFRYLKRSNILISNRNIYLYLTAEIKSIIYSLPYNVITNICYLSEIIKEIESINKKTLEFPELNTIYSLIKFYRFNNFDINTVYFFTRAMNMMLDDNVIDKKDRIYICYNYIFLILGKFSSKLRKSITDENITNFYFSMFVISSDVLWTPKVKSLYDIIKYNPTMTIGALVQSNNLLSHIFYSLEIVFVNKILDDYEVDDFDVRYECRDMLKRKILKYFDKSNGIDRFLLMKACKALHEYIIRKDTLLLDEF